jgi:hypothetical protein
MAALSMVGIYQPEIEGATPCSGYDQAVVNGTVDITGSTLDPSVSSYVPSEGDEFVIISKTTPGPITGTFAGLAEGATVSADGVEFTLSYQGGDGNDVSLTVVEVDPTQIPGVTPDAPDTGAGVTTKNYMLLSALLFALALAYAYAARRSFNK